MSTVELPKGWKLVRFGDVAESIMERVDDPSKAGVERYVGLEHLDSDTTVIRRWGKPEDVEATKLRFYPGDVIYARRRAYQRKLGVADFEGICSAHALVLRARTSTCVPEFLPYFLQGDAFHRRALDISVGSLSPTINWKTLAVQEFALPPLDEQRRIADVLRAADEVVEGLRLVQERMLLTLAAFGAAVATGGVAKSDLTTVADLVEEDRPVTYGILKPGVGFPGGVPVIKVKDYPSGYIQTEDLLLTSPEIDSDYKRSRLRKGDLLISIRGTIGRTAEVPLELAGANITQDTARLTIRRDHDRRYIRHMLDSRFVQEQIEQRISGLAVKGINIGALRQVLVPTPPRTVQRELAERFELIETVLNIEREHMENTRNLRASLLEQLLGGPRE